MCFSKLGEKFDHQIPKTQQNLSDGPHTKNSQLLVSYIDQNPISNSDNLTGNQYMVNILAI